MHIYELIHKYIIMYEISLCLNFELDLFNIQINMVKSFFFFQNGLNDLIHL